MKDESAYGLLKKNKPMRLNQTLVKGSECHPVILCKYSPFMLHMVLFLFSYNNYLSG